MKTGYRIGFHSYKDAARSIFMIHNETMNIWTHFLGALGFVCVVFYVIIYMQPVSLRDDTPLSDRWLSGKFDGGRFDLLQCDKPSFVIPPPVD